MCPVALSSRMSSLARLPGARKSGVPAYIGPCDPTSANILRKGMTGSRTSKLYRAQLHCHAGEVRVYSRKGIDWTDQFATIAAAGHVFKNARW
jgi:bifunctional non-homologous end joining protein LigD